MSKRSYEQFCPLARSLDLLGERWTLLIVRDLLVGPKRYTDLRRGLPGLATDLLTERLRMLEEAGAVRRRELPPPAASTVYELTERGRELETAIFALARFGIGLPAGPPAPDEPITPERVGLLLKLLYREGGPPDLAGTYALRDGELAISFSVHEGELTVHSDAATAPAPVATIDAGAELIYRLLQGEVDPETALGDGSLAVTGDVQAAVRLFAALRAAVPAPAAA